METLVNTTNLPISAHTTVEDILNFSKQVLQTFLRCNRMKISGSKLALAQRIVDAVVLHYRSAADEPPKTSVNFSTSDVPSVNELSAGWSGNDNIFPKLNVKDIESYLIHSSHRTEDAEKMQCYRQYIRGLQFFKEGYIHKLMINEINDNSKLCYMRSKCFPSMQKGVYEQWILLSKEAPIQILKASCTCPAGCGEGCTHIAGLLFALEGRHIKDKGEDEDVPCTSKPCQWNQPSKRKKEVKPIKDMTFKRIRYDDSLKPKKKRKTPQYNVNTKQFRESVCDKLGNTSRAAIFDLIPPYTDNTVSVENDLNVSHSEEIETSEHISFVSDKYINILSTVHDNQMTELELNTFMSGCKQEEANELEFRTRGQSENDLWTTARVGRITASNFHDIKTHKETTKFDCIVTKVLGQSASFSNSAVAWGRRYEPIAKKRYKAYKKLKENKTVDVEDSGLVLCPGYAYIGASPDGVVTGKTQKYLIEIKCPYKWRNRTLADACKNKDFCCYYDESNQIQLKKTHRYYTQVQGQMGVCKLNRCDFVIYTLNDFIIIPVEFDKPFWDELLVKIHSFYVKEVVPRLINQ